MRRRRRRERYERLAELLRPAANPEQSRAASEESERVRRVLAATHPRQASMLVLRSDDLSYERIAAVVQLNPASVGKLLSRAQDAFRKEYVKRYGQVGE